MNMAAIQYIADNKGEPNGVIVPIELWRTIQTRLQFSKPNEPGNAWDVLKTFTGTVEAPSNWPIK